MAVIEPSAAYFDESRVDGSFPFPVVAGFWNPVDMWINCEQQFRRLLRDKPSNVKAKKYVRSNPVVFAKAIATFTIAPMFATIERVIMAPGLHYGKMKDLPLFANEYTACSHAACEVLDEAGLQRGWHKPIKTVFDDGSAYKVQFERGYRMYYAAKSESLLSKTVSFQDDEETPVLLAADLYAWLLAKNYNGGIENTEDEDALNTIHQHHPYFVELTQERMNQFLANQKTQAG